MIAHRKEVFGVIAELRCSLSPQPSPAGRGRIKFCLTKNRVAAFGERPSASREIDDCCPLSQRERVRVRERFLHSSSPLLLQWR